MTVQPATAGAAYTVDGWMDMPGRDGGAAAGTWDVDTEYGGGVDITIGPGRSPSTARSRDRGGAPARRRAAVARDRRPAIEVARTGFRLSAASRYYLDYVHDDIFGWDPASRAAVHDDGASHGGADRAAGSRRGRWS